MGFIISEWAIRKYGGVGIAYNNPNVTFSKVDDMFKEEWAKRRPALANLSIWTLVSYARKFDSLKKQLIQDHNQGIYIVYFRFGFRIRFSNKRI